MKYAENGSGNYSDDASLKAIESPEEGEEGFGIPGQSAVGTVGFYRLADISNQDENSTGLTAPTGHSSIDLTKEPGIVSNEGLSSISPGSLSPIINGTKGSKMSARIAYIMENGEPFCNHCEKNFIPRNLTRVACTNCGCGQPNGTHNDESGHPTEPSNKRNFQNVEGLTIGDLDGGRDIIKEESKIGSVEEYIGYFRKNANDSELYYRGYTDAEQGKELDEDLALLSDDYYHGYDQRKFYNQTAQQSVGQNLFDIKPNSNAIPRGGEITPGEADRGPLQLTDGFNHATASKVTFPTDVLNNFFEI